MGPTCTDENSIACKMSAWEIGGYGLYLQPMNNNVQTIPITISLVDEASITTSDSFPWSWGYRLDAAYHYTSSNDISVNWSQLNSTLSAQSSLDSATSISYGILGGTSY